jgi:hypothetical protein
MLAQPLGWVLVHGSPKVPTSVHTPSVSGTAVAFDEVTLNSTEKVYTR